MRSTRRAALAAILIPPGLAQARGLAQATPAHPRDLPGPPERGGAEWADAATPAHPRDLPGAALPEASRIASEQTPRGAPWTVEEIAGRGVVDRALVELVLLPEGRAGGTGGCNRFTGGYVLDGAAVRFGALAATRMACAPAVMDQEQRFLAAMAEVRGWRIEHGRLLLTDAGGRVVLRLAR